MNQPYSPYGSVPDLPVQGPQGTHKGLVRNAAKKRREYLLAKARCKTIGAVSGLVTLGIIALAVIIFGLAFSCTDVCGALMLAGNVAVLAAIPGAMWRKSAKFSASLVYVPPVREQIAAFPAEEVLLRGSEQPTATPEELLRAAQVGSETASEELLRAEHTP
jgi:hypothetical protein